MIASCRRCDAGTRRLWRATKQKEQLGDRDAPDHTTSAVRCYFGSELLLSFLNPRKIVVFAAYSLASSPPKHAATMPARVAHGVMKRRARAPGAVGARRRVTECCRDEMTRVREANYNSKKVIASSFPAPFSSFSPSRSLLCLSVPEDRSVIMMGKTNMVALFGVALALVGGVGECSRVVVSFLLSVIKRKTTSPCTPRLSSLPHLAAIWLFSEFRIYVWRERACGRCGAFSVPFRLNGYT